jgi:hypothetical protein
MAPSNTSNMARAKADASSTPNTPSSIKLSPLTYFSQAAGFWHNITHSPMTASPRRIEPETDTSNMGRFKADSSSTPNTPSSIKLSPLTILSQVGSWFSHSPVTASPRKIEVEVGNSPKSNSPASASIEIKKGKVKTRGTANACAPPMTTYWIQLDDAPEGKYRTKIRPSPGNNDSNPNPNPSLSTTPSRLADASSATTKSPKPNVSDTSSVDHTARLSACWRTSRGATS